MDNDDRPIGRILSRRDALKLLGLGGAAVLAACTTQQRGNATSVSSAGPTLSGSTASANLDCVVRPELTIGPYFVDDQLNRRDIRSEPSDNSVEPGVPLTLIINVLSVSSKSCSPIEGARVDVWHCNAGGVYSGVASPVGDMTGKKFLRGYRVTDAQGQVQFLTIYPGWYTGRTVHVHFTIRTKGAAGEAYQFTSQFFFDDALTDRVHALQPYASRGPRDTRNANDGIFNSGGSQLVLDLQGNETQGFTSAMNIGLDLTDTKAGAADTMGGPGGPPPGGAAPP